MVRSYSYPASASVSVSVVENKRDQPIALSADQRSNKQVRSCESAVGLHCSEERRQEKKDQRPSLNSGLALFRAETEDCGRDSWRGSKFELGRWSFFPCRLASEQ